MPVEVQNSYNIAERLRELECTLPKGVAVLPRNLDTVSSRDDLLYESTTPTVRKLFQEANIDVDIIGGEPVRQLTQKYIEWVGPIILLTATAYTENAQIASLTIGVISNYLASFFRGIVGTKKVRLGVIVEKKMGSEFVKIDYEGNPDGLATLPEIIDRARNEQ